MASRAANPSSSSLHASPSALVVSAANFVRKSSVLRRPPPQVWTVDNENPH
jgi:hypothetical protein